MLNYDAARRSQGPSSPATSFKREDRVFRGMMIEIDALGSGLLDAVVSR
jgi:hypothetical protein